MRIVFTFFQCSHNVIEVTCIEVYTHDTHTRIETPRGNPETVGHAVGCRLDVTKKARPGKGQLGSWERLIKGRRV